MTEERKPEHPARDLNQRLSIRWKVIQAVGALLIALGLFLEWPPAQDTNVPDTSSFLMILGALLVAVGLLVTWRHE